MCTENKITFSHISLDFYWQRKAYRLKEMYAVKTECNNHVGTAANMPVEKQ